MRRNENDNRRRLAAAEALSLQVPVIKRENVLTKSNIMRRKQRSTKQLYKEQKDTRQQRYNMYKAHKGKGCCMSAAHRATL
ncbi:hypothetical protein K458DRAFT_167691 [Lentithecium fluviatile CBS 122367]|uniref:Uncharacterized protein n=1 Tax=Lentithecium fluviatile CBS 122367 TaxID=1168545 RepID=A0A6G1JB55_9PLEO|nr:hypothetical protein K458DRAFT_167691 [Lentithecium fluviatile CBS 122367]